MVVNVYLGLQYMYVCVRKLYMLNSCVLVFDGNDNFIVV
jgi:hypothetical protein